MADEEKKYIVNIESNLEQYAREADEAAKKLAELTIANQELKASGTATGKDIEKSNAALRTAQKEYTNAKKSVDLATAANKAQAGSYEQLYRQWQLAQTQLKLLGNTYSVNEKGVRVLSQRYIEQSKAVADAKAALDAFGKGVHDNRLNVGSYSEAIEGAIGKFQMLPGPLGAAAGGVKQFGMALKVLAVNPVILVITLLVGAIAGLIKIFKSTDKGANELEARMNQLKAVLDVIRQRVLGFTEAIGNIFKGKWKEAGEGMKETFTGIGDQMRDATKAAYDYTYALDAIEDAEKNYVSTSAENRNKIAKLEYTAQDRTKSTAERKKALQEAMAIGEEDVKAQRDFANQKLNAKIKADVAGKNITEKELIDFVKMTEAERELADQAVKDFYNQNEDKVNAIDQMYADWIDLDTKYYDENKRNMSRMTGFEEEERNKRNTASEKATKEELDRLKKIEEAAKKAAEDTIIQKTLSLDIEEANLDPILAANDKIIANEQNTFDQRIKALQDNLVMKNNLLTAQANLEIAEIDKDEKLKTITTEQAATQRLAIGAKLSADSIRLLEETGEKSRAIMEAQVQEQYDIARERAQYAIEDAGENYAERQAILDAEYQDIKKSEQYFKMSELKKMQLDREYTKATEANSKARIAQKQAELGYISGALGVMSQVIGETTAAGKAFAVAEAVINTWVAASKALADPTIPSTIARIALMVSIIGTGLMTVRKILAVKVPGGGGGGGGGLSAPTAISASAPVARMTAPPAGASVLTQSSQSQLNAQANTPQMTSKELVEALKSMPAPVVTVEDINAKTAAVKKTEVRATI